MKRERRSLRRSRLAVLQCRKHKKIKVLLDFFQKIAESRGRASGRPPQRAKYPRRARRETPSGRSQRNTRPPQRAKSPSVPKRHPQMAQSPRQSRKAAVPTPSRVADGGLLAVPGIIIHHISTQSIPPTNGGTQVPPYEPGQTSHIDYRAGPMRSAVSAGDDDISVR